jgi:hypothetical protein
MIVLAVGHLRASRQRTVMEDLRSPWLPNGRSVVVRAGDPNTPPKLTIRRA